MSVARQVMNVMKLTQTQRFAYTLIAVFFLTAVALTLLNVNALDIFLMLVIVEFLAVLELTQPQNTRALWRRNLPFFIALCVITFGVILYTRMAQLGLR